MGEARGYGLFGLAGVAVALLLGTVGHVGPNHDLDPLSLTVSDFAVADRGGAIEVAMCVVAGIALVLVAGLRRTGLPADRATTAALLAWGGGILLAVLVPTDPPGEVLSTAGYVHRYASIVAFVALPLGTLRVATRLPRPTAARIHLLTALSLAGAVAMLCSAYLVDRALYGLIERLLILAELGLLATVAGALIAYRADPPRPAQDSSPAAVPVGAPQLP